MEAEINRGIGRKRPVTSINMGKIDNSKLVPEW